MSYQEDQGKLEKVKSDLTWVQNIVTYMGRRLQNAPTSAWIVRVGQKEEE
jgi:hypothetical protein